MAKIVTLSVEVEVTDNATMRDVRSAVDNCLANALHVYASAVQYRPHRLTGGPDFSFGYRVRLVRGIHYQEVKHGQAE